MDNAKLKSVIEESGIKISALADKIGISRQSLYMKVSGERNFNQGEILAIKNSLHLDDEQFMAIFFNDCVDKSSTDQV